jgi:N-methylhydantoinase A/oxoprolinase/acetone carboxylase beta subunit
MVVKGDGSLLDAAQAMARPVETILSGPAASVVGASYLSGRKAVIVADMGGTTTDVALLDDGRPVLRLDGANVGGWRTMVEAVAVDTYGLGGDSEVSRASTGLRLGPRRVVPLSLLATEHERILDSLRAQTERPPSAQDGRFVLRQRPLETTSEALSAAQRRLWEALGPGPCALSDLPSGYVHARALERLVSRGLVAIAGFTPTDACHVLGRQAVWSFEAARLGARLYCRAMSGAEPGEDGVVRFCEDVIEQVIVQAGHALVTTALHRIGEDPGESEDSPARRLIDRALRRGNAHSLLGVAVELRRPIVAIGAPVATYFPEIARRVRAELVVPDQSAVANAVGAVAGGVVQTVRAIITSPSSGLFRAHLGSGMRDFADLEAAAAHAAKEVERLARLQAVEAGARDIQLSAHRRDRVVRDAGGGEIFIESAIEAVASGRPRLAGEAKEKGSSS